MMKLCCLTLSYRRTFQAGKMDIWSFIEECRRLDMDGVDLHQDAIKDQDEPYLRRVKRAGESRRIAVRFEAKRGKGSHGTLYFGSSRTILQDLKKELPVGTLHAMLRQLGLTLKDLE